MINVSSTAPMWTGGNTFPLANGTGVRPLTVDQTAKPLRFGDESTPVLPDMWPMPYEVIPTKKIVPNPPASEEILRRWISMQGEHNNLVSSFRTETVGERLIAAIDIPGVKKGTVDVSLDGAVISVVCTRADIGTLVSAKYTVPREYSVSPDDIEAWHDDGVLSIAFMRISQGRVKIGVK